MGTGDRVHPKYNVASDRLYAIYDDSQVAASNDVVVSSIPYSEDDLLNLTCDELGQNTVLTGAIDKSSLEVLLKDDVVNVDFSDPMELDGGNGENDAKGWYIILEKQGETDLCGDCSYGTNLDNFTAAGSDYHFGEKIFSRITLYAGVLYFNSYQRNFDDPCAPSGNSFSYALNYLNGSAAWDLNTANNYGDDNAPTAEPIKDITDRYIKLRNIKALPATLTPIYRKGETRLPTPALEGFNIGEKDRPIYYWIEK